MAELPPLERMPSSGISPEFVGQLEHSANWASTFGGSGTNLAQRKRHNQSMTDYAATLAAQRAEHQAQLLQSDKHAQDMYFGVQKMKLQEEEAKARMAHAAELHPLKIRTAQSQIAADLAREKATVQATDFKSMAEAQRNADRDVFHTALNEGLRSGVKLGTPEFTELVIRARINAPGVPKEDFDSVWKATASKMTPDEAIEQAVAKERAMTAVRNEAKAPAALVSSLEKERALMAKTLDRAKRLRAGAEKVGSEDLKKDADSDIIEAERGLADIESQIRSHREAPVSGDGKKPPTTPPTATIAPGEEKPSDELKAAQSKLKEQGFLYEDPTGRLTTETKFAIRRFQIRNGLEVTDGKLNAETRGAIGGFSDDYQSAADVRAAFKAGALPREQAEALLKNKFGLR